MKPDSNHKYTADDLHRYHSGLMTASEMHALEKAALEDPFLSDALDGYELTQTPKEDINDLKNRLTPKKKESRIAWLPGVLRAAAVLILVAGFSWIIFKKDHEKDPISAIENTPDFQKEQSSALTQNEQFMAPDTIKNISAPHIRNNTYSRIDSTELAVNTPAKFKSPSFPPAGDPVISNVQQDMAAPSTGMEEKSDQPASKAEADMRTDQTFSTTMEKSGGKARKNEMSANRQAATVPGSTATPQMREQSVSRILASRIILKNVSPATDLSLFEETAGDSLKTSYQLNTDPLHGEVKVTFNVKNGMPVDIKVLKNLCMACDAESVRFISSQKWKQVDPSLPAEAIIIF